jgi:hypothetical protein
MLVGFRSGNRLGQKDVDLPDHVDVASTLARDPTTGQYDL